MTQAEIVAESIVNKFKSMPKGRWIVLDELQPSACGDKVFDAAIAIVRRKFVIQSRIWNGSIFVSMK